MSSIPTTMDDPIEMVKAISKMDKRGQFRQIVQNIFCNPNHGGWSLRTLTKASNSAEYDSVVKFLHPDGIFFDLIKSLMAETSAKYEFPISQFPPCFRAMIEVGTLPPFFANKIVSTSYLSASHLILNAFEYYIFHFGLYILNNSGTNYDTTSPATNEPAYFTLLRIYLDYFVPVENIPQPNDGSAYMMTQAGHYNTLWQSLSSKTSNLLNLTSTNTQSVNGTLSQGNSLPSLFKASVFQPEGSFSRNMTHNVHSAHPGPVLYGQGEHLGSVEWRCSTFLLMLTELLFGNIPAPRTNYILRSNSLDDLSISNIQPYCANIDQMTAVRIIVKHLHNFSNSFTYNSISLVNSRALAEIKQAILTSKYPLQKRLYNFIKVAFNRWPMDYTFRQPLEAWLSYIQPWRYVRISGEVQSDIEELEGNRSSSLLDVPSVDNHWRDFVADNLLYYTVIFSTLINRLLQLDLSSSRNALMLFRVVKVYSQPGFLLLVREAENAVLRNNHDRYTKVSPAKSPHKLTSPGRNVDPNISKAKLLAPSFLASGRVSSPKTRIGALEHHLMNLENDPDFNYVPLISPQMKQHLVKLLIEVQRSRVNIREFVQSVEVRSQLRSRSWLDSIRSFLLMEDACFESKDEREMYKDKLQAEEYLLFATNKIAQCFDIQVPEINPTPRSNNLTSSYSQNSKIFFNY